MENIKLDKIEEHCMEKGAYFVLKNTHDLKTTELELDIEITNQDNLEEETIKQYSEENPSDFNNLIQSLMNTLSIEKQEGETVESFQIRLLEESKRILKI